MDENEPPQLWSTARKWKKIVHLTAKTKRFSSVSYDISRTARGVSRLSCMS